MIAAIILAAVTAASAATPAPQAQPTYKPLREVVYDAVANLQVDSTMQTFPGSADDDPQMNGINANPSIAGAPPASLSSTGIYGTVTVDVMAVGPDGTLGIHVTEQWKNLNGRALSYNGAVAPDGTVEFPNQTINDVTRELLSYFGTKFAPVDSLGLGTSWQASRRFSNGNVSTEYSVTKVDGHIVTIQKKQNLEKFNVDTEGTIRYDAANLVPVFGLVTRRMTGGPIEDPGTEFNPGDTTTRDRFMTLRFSLVSDTHQAPPAR